ncbi:MAG TPA: hypothetical protein VJB99_03815 [Patescibacteria group bacterium]|nr:hypothetical protein [Patescibacteria group bacterium]
MDDIEKKRTEIAQIQSGLEDKRNLGKRLLEVFNELATLTADVFIAIDNGSDVVVRGISKECPSTAFGLRISTTNGEVINVRYLFNDGRVTFHLAASGQLSFAITDDEKGGREIHFLIWANRSKTAVETWAKQRRTNRVCL